MAIMHEYHEVLHQLRATNMVAAEVLLSYGEGEMDIEGDDDDDDDNGISLDIEGSPVAIVHSPAPQRR